MTAEPIEPDATASSSSDDSVDSQSSGPLEPADTASPWLGVAAQFVNTPAPVDSMANAIASNLTPDHVTEIIAQRGRESERDHDAGKETRRWAVLVVIIAILAVVGIIVFLTVYKEGGLLGYILSGIGGLIAGAFGGYGYANRPR